MRSLLSTFLLVFFFVSSASAATAVMPLGDSGTLGAYSANDFGIGGYRAPLWSRLTQEGYAVDFVGSVNGPAPQGVDPDHEGHGGWRIDDLDGSIDGWMASSRPDVILLMAGANDIIQGYGVSATVSHMDSLLAEIFVDRPSAVVLLGTLWWVPTPNFYNYDISQIQGVNANLPSLVSKYSNQGRIIQLVDQYNLGWSPSDFNADQIHPNANGYFKMAQAWHDPLANHLSGAGLSPDGTIINGHTGGSLNASSGVWTFGTPWDANNWYILHNGSSAFGGVGSELEVSNGGQLYALGTDNHWYVWTGSTWIMGSPSGGPENISPDGTIISNGTGSLTTTAGAWTFGSSIAGGWNILLNGNSAQGGGGSKMEVNNGGKLYALGTNNNWYVWTGTWVPSNPNGNDNISPDGTAISGGSGSLITSLGTWTFGTFRGSGNWDLLLNGNSAGIGSELEVSQGGQMFGVGTDGTWYRYNGSTWVHGSP